MWKFKVVGVVGSEGGEEGKFSVFRVGPGGLDEKGEIFIEPVSDLLTGDVELPQGGTGEVKRERLKLHEIVEGGKDRGFLR